MSRVQPAAPLSAEQAAGGGKNAFTSIITFGTVSRKCHTLLNRAELNQFFANFCCFWTDGLHATVHMSTNGDCKVRAQLEFELGKPVDIFPGRLRRGQPQVKARRHPGHHQLSACIRPSWNRRASTVIARSRMCAAAQA